MPIPADRDLQQPLYAFGVIRALLLLFFLLKVLIFHTGETRIPLEYTHEIRRFIIAQLLRDIGNGQLGGSQQMTRDFHAAFRNITRKRGSERFRYDAGQMGGTDMKRRSRPGNGDFTVYILADIFAVYVCKRSFIPLNPTVIIDTLCAHLKEIRIRFKP